MPPKLLIVQTAFIGDIILSSPVIEILSSREPEAELWLLTTRAGEAIFRSDPRVRGIITFEKRGRERGMIGLLRKSSELRAHRFDRVYSLHRSARTSMLLALSGIPERIGFDDSKLPFLYTERRPRVGAHEVQRKLSLLGEVCAPGAPGLLRLSSKASDAIGPEVRGVLADPTPYVVLAPGSAWRTKRWSPAGFRAVGDELAGRGYRVVLAGAPDEVEVCGEVAGDRPFLNLSGKTPLDDMLPLIASASAVVCNDSMVLHVASGFQIPVVAVFCATSPIFGFGPWNPNGRVVERRGLECKPCRPHGSRVCPTGTYLCMNDVDMREVFCAIDELLGSGDVRNGAARRVS